MLDELVDDRLRALVDQAARQLVQRLIRERAEELLADGDTELVDGDADATPEAANGSTPPAPELVCASCGVEPRLPARTVCRTCKTARDNEHRRARRRERRPSAADTDGPQSTTDPNAGTVEQPDPLPPEAPGDGDDEHDP